MRGRRDSYRYQEDRNFKLEDGRLKPGYMMIWSDEFMYLWTNATPAALALYVFVGTKVGGNRTGFDLGGQELQQKLKLKRSTLYGALKQLVDLRMATRTTKNGQTVIRLTDAWRQPVQEPGKDQVNGVQESGQDSSIHLDNREDTDSRSTEDPPLLKIPPASSEEPSQDATVQSSQPVDELTAATWQWLTRQAESFEDPAQAWELARKPSARLVSHLLQAMTDGNWQGSKRKRDIIAAFERAAELGPEWLPHGQVVTDAPSEQDLAAELEAAEGEVQLWRKQVDDQLAEGIESYYQVEQLRMYQDILEHMTQTRDELLAQCRSGD